MVEFNRDQFRYPKTEDDDSQGDYVRDQFAGVHRLHGVGDPDALFHGGAISGTPWPRAARNKARPLYDQQRVNAVLVGEDRVIDVDPRFLHATQPNVTRAGVVHYMNSDQWETTGRTFADQGDIGNRYPMVYEKEDGRNLLLSGHHRATAALLRGRGLRARRVQGP